MLRVKNNHLLLANLFLAVLLGFFLFKFTKLNQTSPDNQNQPAKKTSNIRAYTAEAATIESCIKTAFLDRFGADIITSDIYTETPEQAEFMRNSFVCIKNHTRPFYIVVRTNHMIEEYGQIKADLEPFGIHPKVYATMDDNYIVASIDPGLDSSKFEELGKVLRDFKILMPEFRDDTWDLETNKLYSVYSMEKPEGKVKEELESFGKIMDISTRVEPYKISMEIEPENVEYVKMLNYIYQVHSEIEIEEEVEAEIYPSDVETDPEADAQTSAPEIEDNTDTE